MKFTDNKRNFLSNMFNSKFKDSIYTNLEFSSMEHFYQSMKYFIPKTTNYLQHIENIRKIKNADAVKLYTKAYPHLCSNFCNIKDVVMKNGLILKFHQNNNIKQKLLKTKGKITAEIKDSYWGIGKDRKGRNRLGEILEDVRNELKI